MSKERNWTMVDEHGLLWSEEDELNYQMGDIHGEVGEKCIKYDRECDYASLSHLDPDSIPSCTFNGTEKCPEAIEKNIKDSLRRFGYGKRKGQNNRLHVVIYKDDK